MVPVPGEMARLEEAEPRQRLEGAAGLHRHLREPAQGDRRRRVDALAPHREVHAVAQGMRRAPLALLHVGDHVDEERVVEVAEVGVEIEARGLGPQADRPRLGIHQDEPGRGAALGVVARAAGDVLEDALGGAAAFGVDGEPQVLAGAGAASPLRRP